MFNISVDFSFWLRFIDLSLGEQARIIFACGAWVPLAVFLFKVGAGFWVDYRQSVKYTSKWEWVIMAVDIPPLFIQTPKAVEQIFAHLSGTHAHINVMDKYWVGKKQKWFSFEIISIEGYIQFLVRTEKEFRDLVEASIYAQYTEAQITEVEDYVSNIPDHFPDEEYDVMGVDFKLAADPAYPIRTYPSFQYNLSKDAVFSDPMAAILENFTRIGRGENLWMHIIIEPSDNSWKEQGIALAKQLMSGDDGHGHHGGGLSGAVLGLPMTLMNQTRNIITWDFESHGGHEEKKERVDITPGTRLTVEAIEEKISKLGFKSKLRLLYAAKKSAYSPNRCIEGFVGSINQFQVMSRNAIVPYMATHAHYDSKHKKSYRLKNTFVKHFKKRKMKWKLNEGYILNIEELATVWHFPLPFVKTPLLQKAGHKKAEPPSGLPVESSESPLKRKGQAAEEPKDLPPENLPFA